MSPSEQKACFDQWLSEHAAVLHHVARAFAGGADRQDLMQELLLAIWRAVPAFRGDARASTFIYRVAHNAALTWTRAEKGHRRRRDQFEALALPESATALADEEQTLARLYAEIRRLPPVDRSLLLLHLDGVGYAEIGEIHGLGVSNVGVRLSRLKQRLSSAMNAADVNTTSATNTTKGDRP